LDHPWTKRRGNRHRHPHLNRLRRSHILLKEAQAIDLRPQVFGGEVAAHFCCDPGIAVTQDALHRCGVHVAEALAQGTDMFEN
jgi:hypothetical protein